MSAEWSKGSLQNLVTLQRGYDITKADQHEGLYPVISSSGIKSSHVEYRVQGPGVVIGRKGSLGTVFYCEGPFWPHDTTLWVKDFHKNDPRYCYYFLQTMRFEQYDVGASNPTLNRNHVHGLPICIPPPDMQRRIAGVLSTYDDLIDNNTRRIAILEEMARRLYEEWFVHFRFPGYETASFRQTPDGRLPQGWQLLKLKDEAELVMGSSPNSDFYNTERVGLPFHQGVTDFGTISPTNRVYCSCSGRLAEPGDVLLSVRAPVGRINMAVERLILGRGLAAVRSKYDRQDFIRWQLKHRFAVEDSMGSGSIFNAVTKRDLESVECVVPANYLVSKFQSFARPLGLSLQNLCQQNATLRAQRDLILPKLVVGEIDLAAAEALAMAAE